VQDCVEDLVAIHPLYSVNFIHAQYVFVSGYEFRRLVCLVSLFYVLF